MDLRTHHHPSNELDPKYDNLFKSIIGAGWNDESNGDVESPPGRFTIISYSPTDKSGFMDMLDDEEHRDLFEELDTGFFVTTENQMGLIWVFYFALEHDAREWYNDRSEQYCAWEDED